MDAKSFQTTKLAGFSLMFTDIYPNWVMKPTALVRCDKATRLIIHTWVFKLFNQAAWPSRSINLAGRLAVWMRHNVYCSVFFYELVFLPKSL